MTDSNANDQTLADRLRAVVPAVPDDGFTAAVIRRIRRRRRMFAALPVVTGTLGLAIALPALIRLVESALGPGRAALQTIGQLGLPALGESGGVIIAAIAMGILTPLVIALLEN